MPYCVRVWLCTALMLASCITVAYGRTTAWELLGVCFSSLQAGLGEATFLALSALYDTPRALTAWSSGTGCAGIFGYAWVLLLHFSVGVKLRFTVLAAALLAVPWLFAYFALLGESCQPGDARNLTGRAYPTVDSLTCLSSPSVGPKGSQHQAERGELLQEEQPLSRRTETAGHSEGSSMTMTARQRWQVSLGLWRYTVPLMLVSFAEVSTEE